MDEEPRFCKDCRFVEAGWQFQDWLRVAARQSNPGNLSWWGPYCYKLWPHPVFGPDSEIGAYCTVRNARLDCPSFETKEE
jgi:hypothetical protein